MFNILSVKIIAEENNEFFINNEVDYYEIYKDLEIVISNEYIEPKEEFESFYVTDNNLMCLSFYNKYIYEYYEGSFNRIVRYKSFSIIYSMYDENNQLLLIIQRKRVRICIDNDGNFLYGDSYKDEKALENKGVYFIYGDTIKDFEIMKGEFKYSFTNSNIFERLINKTANIKICNENLLKVEIKENRGINYQGLFAFLIILPIGILLIIIKKKIKIRKYK